MPDITKRIARKTITAIIISFSSNSENSSFLSISDTIIQGVPGMLLK